MSRIRRRRARARIGDPPSARERELWRLLSRNLRQRAEAANTPAESVALRLESIELGNEAQALWRERTGRR
jgi:hypothetical protein